MADDFLDFLPLYPDQDEATIRGRWQDWANEGITPVSVDQWTDVREGSFFWVMTSGGVREAARMYDLMGTEVPMSAFILWAWAEYLDDHGEPFDLQRLGAASAAGVVRFSGADGIVVPAGTRVGVPPVSLEQDAPEYETTLGGTITAGFVDLPVEADAPGVFGNVAEGAVTLLLTPISGVAVNNLAPIIGGTDAEEDEAFRARLLAAFTGQGGGNEADYLRWARDYEGVGRATVIPLFAGPGTVLVIIMTASGGPVSTQTVEGLQQELDPPSWSTLTTASVTLPQVSIPVSSTADSAPDTSGHIRLGDQLVFYESKDATHFLGCAGGVGTFASGTLVSQSGRGSGEAPVGHVVVIKTATVLVVAVDATVEPEDGYTLDGFGGTVALEAAITAAITDYVGHVEPGGEIVVNQIIGRITQIAGVHDVAAVEINGSPANLPVPGDPAPQAPEIGTVTLTQGSV